MLINLKLQNDLANINKLNPRINSVKIDPKSDQLVPSAKRSRIKNLIYRFVYKITCGHFGTNKSIDQVTQRVLKQLERLDIQEPLSVQEKNLLKNSIGKLIAISHENSGRDEKRLKNILRITIEKIQTLDVTQKIQAQKQKEKKQEQNISEKQTDKEPFADKKFPFMQLPKDIKNQILKLLDEKDQKFFEEAIGLKNIFRNNPVLLANNIEKYPWRFSKEELIQYVIKCGPLIKKLNLIELNINDEQFIQIISACPNLRYLSISDCFQISTFGLSEIKKMAHLQVLKLEGENIDNATLERLSPLKSLTSLHLVKTNIENIEKIDSFKNLQSLKIYKNNFDGKGLEKLAALKNLKHLDLSLCTHITSENWQTLAFAESLQVLFLDQTHFSDLKIISNLRNLVKLDLSRCPITDDGIKYLANLENLKQLRMNFCKDLSDLGLKEIALLDKLKTLKIRDCPKVTGKFFKDAKEFSCLQTLDIAHCDISDDFFENLKIFQNLKKLLLDSCVNLTNVGFKKIANLKNLEVLGLSNTNISSEGLEGIAALPNLRELDLHHSFRITDAGLKILARATTLQDLNLAETNITVEGLLSLLPLDNLKKLSILRCSNIKNSKPIYFPKNLNTLFFSSCENVLSFKDVHFPDFLQHLTLGFTNVQDEDLFRIALLKKLQKINLYNCQKISEQGLKKFKELTQNRVEFFCIM